MTNQWDQRDGEPAAAYRRFLIYLALGRSRSLDTAYATARHQRVSKGIRAPGQWRRDCQFAWVERAAAYDAHQIRTTGMKAVDLFVEALCRVAASGAEAAKRIRPKTMGDVLDLLQFLSTNIPREIIAALSASPEPVPVVGVADGAELRVHSA